MDGDAAGLAAGAGDAPVDGAEEADGDGDLGMILGGELDGAFHVRRLREPLVAAGGVGDGAVEGVHGKSEFGMGEEVADDNAIGESVHTNIVLARADFLVGRMGFGMPPPKSELARLEIGRGRQKGECTGWGCRGGRAGSGNEKNTFGHGALACDLQGHGCRWRGDAWSWNGVVCHPAETVCQTSGAVCRTDGNGSGGAGGTTTLTDRVAQADGDATGARRVAAASAGELATGGGQAATPRREPLPAKIDHQGVKIVTSPPDLHTVGGRGDGKTGRSDALPSRWELGLRQIDVGNRDSIARNEGKHARKSG